MPGILPGRRSRLGGRAAAPHEPSPTRAVAVGGQLPTETAGEPYFGTTLRGCLLEVLDQFRPNLAIEQRLREVDHLFEKLDLLLEEPEGVVPGAWLTRRRVAHAYIRDDAEFVDVDDDATLAALDRCERIRDAVVEYDSSCRLDHGTIRLAGSSGRRITQAVSAEVNATEPDVAGIRYTSRISRDEECWAVFDDRCSIEFDPDPVRLSSTTSEHRQALASAADLLGLTLPPPWNAP